ncbi:MAG: hypothetical protein MUQ10_05280, partial [Anaerolineae bacterium]|nr:hypothetical protein [Anaerolineae bacterium]
MKSTKHTLWVGTMIGILLIVVLFGLINGPLGELGQALAQHKPGIWANPAWYIVLLVGLALLLVVM